MGRTGWRGEGLAVYSEGLKLFQQLSDSKGHLAVLMTSGLSDSPRVMLVESKALQSTLLLLVSFS